MNQLDVCQLEDEEVIHICMELLDEKTNNFIEQLPNPSTWEISNSDKGLYWDS